MPIPHIPALRAGRWYDSVDSVEAKDVRTGEALARVSMVNAGLIRRDLARLDEAARALRTFAVRDILKKLEDAANLFATGTLPLGDATQSPDQYMATLSATSGLPQTLVRRHVALSGERQLA